MNTLQKYLLASVITVISIAPVTADEKQHRVCDKEAMVELRGMGMVNEEVLLEHIAKVKDQMKNVRHARGSHISQKRELKLHLSNMQVAMQELHDQMYSSGCEGAMHGASLETRVEVMEKHMGMMQAMMEQLLEHLSEQEQ